MNVDAVAGASVEMWMAKAQMDVSTSILEKTMDFEQMAMETLISDMMPSFGHMMDIRV